MQHRELRLRSSSYQTKSSTFFEHLISQRQPQARERSGGHHDGAITTFHGRIKISSFHFPPVGFAGFFSCPITGSVLLLYQLPSAWRPLVVALFARICGLHDVAKGVADTLSTIRGRQRSPSRRAGKNGFLLGKNHGHRRCPGPSGSRRRDLWDASSSDITDIASTVPDVASFG